MRSCVYLEILIRIGIHNVFCDHIDTKVWNKSPKHTIPHEKVLFDRIIGLFLIMQFDIFAFGLWKGDDEKKIMLVIYTHSL